MRSRMSIVRCLSKTDASLWLERGRVRNTHITNACVLDNWRWSCQHNCSLSSTDIFVNLSWSQVIKEQPTRKYSSSISIKLFNASCDKTKVNRKRFIVFLTRSINECLIIKKTAAEEIRDGYFSRSSKQLRTTMRIYGWEKLRVYLWKGTNSETHLFPRLSTLSKKTAHRSDESKSIHWHRDVKMQVDTSVNDVTLLGSRCSPAS